jgi:glutaredoxin
MAKPKVTAYLKPSCGWSRGVRAVLGKYGLEFDDKDIVNHPENYQEMVRKTGQPLQPTVEIDGHILADISGDELEAYLEGQGYEPVGPDPDVATDTSCSDEEHEAMAREQSAPAFFSNQRLNG